MKLPGLDSFKKSKLFFLLIFFLPIVHCKGQSNSPDSLGPKMTFENDTVNYGKIYHNSNPYKIIKVYNTGKEPLLIENIVGDVVQVVNYHKTPILPGQSSEIAIMRPIGGFGPFVNFLAITSNSNPNPKIIFVRGTVVPGEEPTPKK